MTFKYFQVKGLANNAYCKNDLCDVFLFNFICITISRIFRYG